MSKPFKKERDRIRNAANYQKNKDKYKWGHISRKYGLSQSAWEDLFDGQGSCCAMCGEGEDFVVDHHHISGMIRGILCRKCNTMLGMARDNPAFLAAGIEYLEKHHGQ